MAAAPIQPLFSSRILLVCIYFFLSECDLTGIKDTGAAQDYAVYAIGRDIYIREVCDEPQDFLSNITTYQVNYEPSERFTALHLVLAGVGFHHDVEPTNHVIF